MNTTIPPPCSIDFARPFGPRFETNLAGENVLASVQEFEPITRIAWGGFPTWIITATPKGCHLWTEETMQGPYCIELAKKAPDAVWRTHQMLLEALAKVATEREGSRMATAVR